MRVRKFILDSDEEDEVVIEVMPDMEDSPVNHHDVALNIRYDNGPSPSKPTPADRSKTDSLATGLPSPTDLRSSKTLAAESLDSTAKSPSMPRVKRAKTSTGQSEALTPKVKKLYGTKTTMDDLRVREGRRSELWEQALGSDTIREVGAKKLKRRMLNSEEEPKRFEEIISRMKPSQESSAPEGILDLEMDQLETALDLHNGDLDQPEQSNRFADIDKIDRNDPEPEIRNPDHLESLATPQASKGANAPKHFSMDDSPAHNIAISIPKHDTNVSQSPIIAPSISQLAKPPDQAPTKSSKKREQSLVSSQADELASDDIGLPKEQYKPRPSRSRRQNDHVDELVKGIDYSKTVESIVRNSKKGKTKKAKAKRRQTTGCFLGTTNDWDDDDEGSVEKKEDQEVQVIDEVDFVPKSQRKGETAATESGKPKVTLHVSPTNKDEKVDQHTSNKANGISSTMSYTQNEMEFGEDVVIKPKRGRKPSTTPKSEPIILEGIAEDDEQDDLDADVLIKPRRRRKSTTTEPKEPAFISTNIEDVDEDEFHPLEDLAEPLTVEPISKKKRGRPKKPDTEPIPEPQNGKPPNPAQPANDSPPKPTSKRRKTKDALPAEKHATPPPTSQPLTESPTKANGTLPPLRDKISQNEDEPPAAEKVPLQVQTPQKHKGDDRGNSRGGVDEKPSQTPSKKPHSPLSNSKVPLRVGLSRRQRIEPLLRVRR